MPGREGFNLFSKWGRLYFFKRGLFGDKGARNYVLQDTFGRFICKVIGHGKTFETDDFVPEDCCLRCFQKISTQSKEGIKLEEIKKLKNELLTTRAKLLETQLYAGLLEENVSAEILKECQERLWKTILR